MNSYKNIDVIVKKLQNGDLIDIGALQKGHNKQN